MNRQLFQYHPTIGYTFIPGLRARINHEGGGYLVKVNQAGFRCNLEVVSQIPNGKFRILIFGDSFTAGGGVSNKYRYSDVLETLLPDVEVYNFGLPGTGTDQQYLAFREFAEQMDYDLIVAGVMVENILRVACRYRPYRSETGEGLLMAKPYFSLNNGELNLHNVPVPKDAIVPDALDPEQRQHVYGGSYQTLRKVINKFGTKAKDLAQRVTRYQPVPAYSDPQNPDWLLMKAILKKWFSECKTDVILFPIPLYQYVEETSSPDDYIQRFSELNTMPGVHIHNPLLHMVSYSKEERRKFRFAKDMHPTPACHRVLAETLAKKIATLVGTRSH